MDRDETRMFTNLGKADWDEIRISPETSKMLMAMVSFPEETWDHIISRLLDYKDFYDHIQNHFKKDHPDWEVKCKICDRSYAEILAERNLKKIKIG